MSLSQQTTDDIVSSAECSSDDEDLEECDSGHAGGISVLSCACSQPVLFPPDLFFDLLPRKRKSPLSITSHGSFKCNFSKSLHIMSNTSVGNVHLG